jgi:peptidyl-prolyl cis-trans isomerase A (cyclophilin A)
MKKVSPIMALVVIAALALISYVLISDKTDISQDVALINVEQSNSRDTVDPLIETATDGVSIETPEVQEQKIMKATFTTNKGSFEVELLNDLAPKTVENFTTLATSNFYDGVKFHRVIAGFMIQSGDPLSKDEEMSDRWGTGGPGYQFEDEIHAENKNIIGSLSMANAGPNTNGSQFFVNTADNSFLDTKHTVFGNIVSGMDVVSAIESVETLSGDRPVEAVVIESITIS